MKRKAPKQGYNFEEKNTYRKNVWKHFQKNISEPSKAKVVFMPSKEGLEIDIALSYGFKEENLIAIDDNPALLATAKWRKKYPKVKCYGSEITRAIERIFKDNIEIDAINMDLCSNVSMSLIETFENVLIKMGFHNRKKELLLAITLLRGRENGVVTFFKNSITNDLLSKLNQKFDDRISLLIYNSINKEKVQVKKLYNGKYHNGISSMGYAIMKLRSPYMIIRKELKNKTMERFIELDKKIQKLFNIVKHLRFDYRGYVEENQKPPKFRDKEYLKSICTNVNLYYKIVSAYMYLDNYFQRDISDRLYRGDLKYLRINYGSDKNWIYGGDDILSRIDNVEIDGKKYYNRHRLMIDVFSQKHNFAGCTRNVDFDLDVGKKYIEKVLKELNLSIYDYLNYLV